MKFLINFLNSLKANKIYLCLLFSFSLLFIYHYPAVQTDITFFHLDDYNLISILAGITDFDSFIKFIFNVNHFKFRPVANLQYFIE